MIQDIVHAIEIRAPRARVWQVVTQPELVAEWLGCIGFECTLGHVFYMQQDPSKRAAGDISGATHCEITRIDAPDAFEFSWYYPETPRTLVAMRLSDIPGGTRAELVHSGWDQFEPEQIRAIRDMLDGGWSSFVLPQLQRVAERA